MFRKPIAIVSTFAVFVFAAGVASHATRLRWTVGTIPQYSLSVLEIIISEGDLEVVYRRAAPSLDERSTHISIPKPPDRPSERPPGSVKHRDVPHISRLSFAGASLAHVVIPDSRLEGFAATIPLWIPFILLATYPAAVLLLRLRGRTGRYRRAHALCVKCGYNLTGNTSGRCPECASPIQP